MVLCLIEDDQKDHSARPEANRNRKRTRRGTLRISMSRERIWGSFSSSSLHVPVFSAELHPAPFILRTARSFCHRGVPHLIDDIVHRLGGRLNRRRARRAAETPVASPFPLVEIEIDEGNILELDVFPD